MLDGFDINKSNFSRPKCLLYIVSSDLYLHYNIYLQHEKTTDIFSCLNLTLLYINTRGTHTILTIQLHDLDLYFIKSLISRISKLD